jgi:hypothetical protein
VTARIEDALDRIDRVSAVYGLYDEAPFVCTYLPADLAEDEATPPFPPKPARNNKPQEGQA